MIRLFFALWLSTFFGQYTFAHESRPAYLEIVQEEMETYRFLFKVPAKGQNMRLNLSIRFAPGTLDMMVPSNIFTGDAYLERRIINRPMGLRGTDIRVEGLSSTITDVLVRIEHLDGMIQVGRMTPDSPVIHIQKSPEKGAVAKSYGFLGIKHIWYGLDHLLFVACLMMIARTKKRLLISISGFTLAHSLTLGLSTMDIVRLPVPAVEAVIALSILYLAYELVNDNRDSFTARNPIMASILFGLLHGFGFAAVLSELGLPPLEVPTALLFFNLGVELGQLQFICLLGGSYYIFKKLRNYFTDKKFARPLSTIEWPSARIVISYMAGITATYWLIERTIAF